MTTALTSLQEATQQMVHSLAMWKYLLFMLLCLTLVLCALNFPHLANA